MTPEKDQKNTLGMIFAAWTLRIWLGLRSFQTGLEKYAGTREVARPTVIDGQPNEYGLETATSVKVYGLEQYSGVPSGMKTQFQNEPLIPDSLLGLYDSLLGPLLLVLGVTLLLGICTRISLFAMGLVYTSLTFGLILLNQSAGVAWLGTHIILIVMMLMIAGHNKIELGEFASRLKFLSFLKNK